MPLPICCLLWVDGSQHGKSDDAPEVTRYNTTSSNKLSHTQTKHNASSSSVIGIFNPQGMLDLFISWPQMNGYYVTIVYTWFRGQIITMIWPINWLSDSANQPMSLWVDVLTSQLKNHTVTVLPNRNLNCSKKRKVSTVWGPSLVNAGINPL